MNSKNLEFFLDLNPRQFIRNIKQAADQFEKQSGKMERSAKGGASKIKHAYEVLDIKPFRDIQREIKQTEAAYNRLARSGTVKGKELARVQDHVKKRVHALRMEMAATNKQVSALGSNIGSLVKAYVGMQAIRAITVLLTDATRVYAKYDDVIRQAGAVSNATAEEIADMRAIAEEMGEKTRYSATQAAEALKFLGMAGFTVSQQLAALPSVLELAAAGALDLGDAADIVTNILTGYGKEVAELGTINDMLVATFTNSNTSLQEVGAGFSYAGPVAKAAGQDFVETATMLGIFANAGFKGERGGTALRGALSRLIRPMRMTREGLADLQWSAHDATGKLKPMTQIVQELKEKGASAASVIKIFGIEAGPAMAAAIGVSTAEIEKLKQKIVDSAGEAQRVSEEMEEGVGGARRRLAAGWEAVQIAIGKALEEDEIELWEELTRALKENKDGIVDIVENLAALIEMGIKAGIAIGEFVVENRELIKLFAMVATSVWGVHKALLAYRFIAGAMSLGKLLAGLGGISTAAGSAATAIKGLSMGMKLGLVGAVGFAAFEVGKLISLMWELHQLEKEQAGLDAHLVTIKDKLAVKLKKISEHTGVAITNAREFSKAIREGRIHFNKATGVWEKGSGVLAKISEAHKKASTAIKATGDDLDEFSARAKKNYQKAQENAEKFADKIKDIEDKIAGLKLSSEDKVRAMRRKTMTDEKAWQDQRIQAEEKLAKVARLTALGGEKNLESAAELAKQASTLYAGLQTEITKTVKGKEKVVKSLETTTKTAIAGVEEANGALEKVYQAQKREAGASLKAWNEMAAAIKKELDALVADRAANVEITLENLDQIERNLEQLARDRNVTITVREVESHSTGGMAGFQRRTGYLPGYGGGDILPSWLEPGEFIEPKDAVQFYGLDFMEAIRYKKLPKMGYALGGLFEGVASAVRPFSVQPLSLAAQGSTGDTYNLSMAFSGEVSPPSRQNARQLTDMVMARLKQMHRGAS